MNSVILSAHQPHYLPWLPYFFKMLSADYFVLADDVQFKSSNYINRTRIKNASGFQWLTVPVRTRGKMGQKIKDVRIVNENDWRRKHWKSITVNYGKSPFFEQYSTPIQSLYRKPWRFLLDLNIASIETVLRMMNLTMEIKLSSELNIFADRTMRILEMAKLLDCDTYLSGPTGQKYMDMKLFQEKGVRVCYSRYHFQEYGQQFGEFLPNMSIIDLIFNEGDDALDILMGRRG